MFSLLLASVAIPLPAMTPALLSGAASAMSVIATPKAAPARFVPVYFMPVRLGQSSAPAMLPDTALLGIAEPESVINEIGVDRGLPFDALSPIPVVSAFDRPTAPWLWPIHRSGGGGGGVGLSSPVPEPATWAMLISGFTLAGVFLRRSRRITTSTVAA